MKHQNQDKPSRLEVVGRNKPGFSFFGGFILCCSIVCYRCPLLKEIHRHRVLVQVDK